MTCAPTWVIDPVDGTTNFVHSYPNVCVSIGLVVGCDVKLGVIFNPILDMFFRAIKGEGAFLNDEPIKVSGVKSKYFKKHLSLFEKQNTTLLLFSRTYWCFGRCRIWFSKNCRVQEYREPQHKLFSNKCPWVDSYYFPFKQ